MVRTTDGLIDAFVTKTGITQMRQSNRQECVLTNQHFSVHIE